VELGIDESNAMDTSK